VKWWIARAASAVVVVLLLFFGLWLATRAVPAPGGAMAMAAYANADALAEIFLRGDERGK